MQTKKTPLAVSISVVQQSLLKTKQLFFVVTIVALQRCETAYMCRRILRDSATLTVIKLGRQREVKGIMFTACET